MAIVGPLKLSLQVMRGASPAIGPGKALVMDAVKEHGSISAAGRATGMSYRRIWLLVEALNSDWQERVIETRVGGGPAGGAQLTPFGQLLLDRYRAIEAAMLAAAAGPDLEWLYAGLRSPTGADPPTGTAAHPADAGSRQNRDRSVTP